MTYLGFLSLLQLTWGTPAGKRDECSFKGKNLEVRDIFFCLFEQCCKGGKKLQWSCVLTNLSISYKWIHQVCRLTGELLFLLLLLSVCYLVVMPAVVSLGDKPQ